MRLLPRNVPFPVFPFESNVRHITSFCRPVDIWWDVEGYFQEGCADEAALCLYTLRLEKRKDVLIIWLHPAVIMFIDNAINNHLFTMHAALDSCAGIPFYLILAPKLNMMIMLVMFVLYTYWRFYC